jgi:Putative ER transporter, 6TM, N-terminal
MSMYRAQPVADTLGSLGYLVAIISSISFAMAPRAKFFQQLIRHILFTCASVPYGILALYCARVARDNTQAPGDTNRYNSSAAAISAIFLFFNVWVANSLRAVAVPPVTSAKTKRYPSLMISIVMLSIATNVSLTLGYVLPVTLPIYYLPKRVLIDFLFAFGLAAGVNVVIFPVTTRTIFFVILKLKPS